MNNYRRNHGHTTLFKKDFLPHGQCHFYLRHGYCKNQPSCQWEHPELDDTNAKYRYKNNGLNRSPSPYRQYAISYKGTKEKARRYREQERDRERRNKDECDLSNNVEHSAIITSNIVTQKKEPEVQQDRCSNKSNVDKNRNSYHKKTRDPRLQNIISFKVPPKQPRLKGHKNTPTEKHEQPTSKCADRHCSKNKHRRKNKGHANHNCGHNNSRIHHDKRHPESNSEDNSLTDTSDIEKKRSDAQKLEYKIIKKKTNQNFYDHLESTCNVNAKIAENEKEVDVCNVLESDVEEGEIKEPNSSFYQRSQMLEPEIQISIRKTNTKKNIKCPKTKFSSNIHEQIICRTSSESIRTDDHLSRNDFNYAAIMVSNITKTHIPALKKPSKSRIRSSMNMSKFTNNCKNEEHISECTKWLENGLCDKFKNCPHFHEGVECEIWVEYGQCHNKGGGKCKLYHHRSFWAHQNATTNDNACRNNSLSEVSFKSTTNDTSKKKSVSDGNNICLKTLMRRSTSSPKKSKSIKKNGLMATAAHASSSRKFKHSKKNRLRHKRNIESSKHKNGHSVSVSRRSVLKHKSLNSENQETKSYNRSMKHKRSKIDNDQKQINTTTTQKNNYINHGKKYNSDDDCRKHLPTLADNQQQQQLNHQPGICYSSEISMGSMESVSSNASDTTQRIYALRRNVVRMIKKQRKIYKDDLRECYFETYQTELSIEQFGFLNMVSFLKSIKCLAITQGANGSPLIIYNSQNNFRSRGHSRPHPHPHSHSLHQHNQYQHRTHYHIHAAQKHLQQLKNNHQAQPQLIHEQLKTNTQLPEKRLELDWNHVTNTLLNSTRQKRSPIAESHYTHDHPAHCAAISTKKCCGNHRFVREPLSKKRRKESLRSKHQAITQFTT